MQKNKPVTMSQEDILQQTFITAEQAAELLQVCPDTIRHYMQTGKIPTVKLARIVRVETKGFLAFIKRS